MLTADDATFAAMADAAGVECLLVGDSLGMVCQGLPSTVGVSLETIRLPHRKRGARTAPRAGHSLADADLPFGSYHESREQALRSATVLMQAGAHMVKLEGGGWTTDTVRFLVERGIPVCAHLGLTPQTVHALGGNRIRGKGSEAATLLKQHAHAMQDAGAAMLVLVLVLVLVLHDMLGINLGKMAKFVRNFMLEEPGIAQALQGYVRAVKDGSFPDDRLHAW